MSAEVVDYLTKQVTIDKNVVTFRSLSRHFNIHVNVAKNELLAFHASSQSSEEPAYATYLLSGGVLPNSKSKANRNPVNTGTTDVDQDVPEDDFEDGDVVPQTRLTLVGERELESAKSEYMRIYSQHIYCLSPSPVIDADIICGPTEQVQKADEKLTADASVLLGRVTGTHVRVGKYVKPVVSQPKVSERPAAKSVRSELREDKNEVEEKDKAEDISDMKEKHAASVKPKATGKLDWSKAKPKAKTEATNTKEKVKDDLKVEDESKEAVEMEVDAVEGKVKKVTISGSKDRKAKPGTSLKPKEDKSTKTVKQSTALKDSSPSDSDVKQRGKKRKSMLPTDTDSEGETSVPRKKSRTPPLPMQSKPRTGAKLNGKKNIVLSDDEEEVVSTSRAKGKAKVQAQAKSTASVIESDAEMSLRAMMDIDDEHVIKASGKREKQREDVSGPEGEPEQAVPMEDIEMAGTSDDEPVKPKTRKKKEKKVWPVGHNGLRKRRVVKSRMTFDEKGYMVTEDYSEYESVDEEDPEAEVPKAKSTAKSKKPAGEERNAIRASDPLKDDAPRKSKSSASDKPKHSGSSSGTKSEQGNLRNFFGKK